MKISKHNRTYYLFTVKLFIFYIFHLSYMLTNIFQLTKNQDII
jgi:hypothetical protein